MKGDIKHIRVDGHQNENIDYVAKYLAEKNEPFILFFSNDSGNLQMASHGMTVEHVKETLKIALDGMNNGVAMKMLHSNEKVSLDS